MPVMKKLFAAKGEPAPDWRVPVMAMGTNQKVHPEASRQTGFSRI